MISVFDVGATGYTGNGSAVLMPTSCIMREKAGGSYELTLTHPIDQAGKWQHLQPMALLKVPVPVKTISGAYTGGDFTVYRTTETAPLRSGPYEQTRLIYNRWVPFAERGQPWDVGQKVTEYNGSTPGRNWLCIYFDAQSILADYAPSQNSSWWQELPEYTGGAPIITRIPEGTEIYLVEAMPGTGWARVMTRQGIKGYIRTDMMVYVRDEHQQPVEQRTVTDQLSGSTT